MCVELAVARLRHVSALLTLLLAAFLAGPSPAAQDQSAAARFYALDGAQGAADLAWKQTARDAAPQRNDDLDGGDPASLPPSPLLVPADEHAFLEDRLVYAAAQRAHGSYQARAPPAV